MTLFTICWICDLIFVPLDLSFDRNEYIKIEESIIRYEDYDYSSGVLNPT